MKDHDYAWLMRFRMRMLHDDLPAIVDAIDALLEQVRTQPEWAEAEEQPVLTKLPDPTMH